MRHLGGVSPSAAFEPFLQHGQAVPAPEWLVVDDQERRTEDVLRQGFVRSGLGLFLDFRGDDAVEQVLPGDAQRSCQIGQRVGYTQVTSLAEIGAEGRTAELVRYVGMVALDPVVGPCRWDLHDGVVRMRL